MYQTGLAFLNIFFSNPTYTFFTYIIPSLYSVSHLSLSLSLSHIFFLLKEKINGCSWLPLQLLHCHQHKEQAQSTAGTHFYYQQLFNLYILKYFLKSTLHCLHIYSVICIWCFLSCYFMLWFMFSFSDGRYQSENGLRWMWKKS